MTTDALVTNAPTEETPSAESGGSAFPWGDSSTPVLDSDATSRLVSALPEETFKLIIREAYLFRAGQIIFQAMSDAKARHELVTSTRPPFFAFRRAETKEAFSTKLATVDEDLSQNTRAMKRNAAAMKHLRQCTELHIEDWLRANDANYYAGLVSESLVADWHRCLARLESELAEFIAAVGCARNSLVAAKADASGVRFASDISRLAITHAATAGALLTNEVAATNALADERDRHLAGTAFESTFPRLPTFDFGWAVQDASELPVSQLQLRFTEILRRCDDLRSVGLPALLHKVQHAEAQHTGVKKSYLVGVWQALREFCLEHYVEDHDLNEVARTTEQMFERGAFA